MKTTLYILYLITWVLALVRLWRSLYSTKAKIIWSLVATLLPLGAVLSLVNKPARQPRLRGTVTVYALLMSASAFLYGAGFRWYKVQSVSMQPTIVAGENVIGRLSSSYSKKARRLDVVIYRAPKAPNTVYTSRIVGMPGDRVVIRSDTLLINGKTIRALNNALYRGPKECDVHLDANSVFVLGDNEENSLDSRSLGPVPLANLIGYLVFKK